MLFSEFFSKVDIADGFSFNVVHGCAPEKGFAVSIFKGLEKTFEGCPNVAQLADYVIANYDILTKTPGYDVVFGGWLDAETGLYYLDCSVIAPSLLDALQLARDNEQLAVFNLATFETIYA